MGLPFFLVTSTKKVSKKVTSSNAEIWGFEDSINTIVTIITIIYK
jgi:hypothetical protein